MSALKLALIGGGFGLAWSASLRGYMVELAGSATRVEWLGTFAQILLPGVIIGVLFGVAEHFRRTGGRRGWRWIAAAPLLFAIAPQFTPGNFEALVTTGIGGGAVAVALSGMLGGFALSGRGPLWGRIVAAVPALALIVGGAIAFFLFDAYTPGIDDARGVWVGILSASLSVIFAFACSIPHRRVVVASLG